MRTNPSLQVGYLFRVKYRDVSLRRVCERINEFAKPEQKSETSQNVYSSTKVQTKREKWTKVENAIEYSSLSIEQR
jgi:hypothetical protein